MSSALNGHEGKANVVLDFVVMSMQASIGIYTERLDPNSREIRLLTIHPGKEVDKPTCTLKRVSLNDNPKFEALSYAWGDSTDRKEIVVDRSILKVTNNLEAAIRHLRCVSEPRTLWIDALCINQDDTYEKSQQVRLMGEIYTAADQVLMWLGEGRGDSDFVMDQINNGFNSGQSVRYFEGILRIVLRPYFTRLWIVQEFALASKEPKVCCGHKWVCWGRFQPAFEFFQDLVHAGPRGFVEAIRIEHSQMPASTSENTYAEIALRNVIKEHGSDISARLLVVHYLSRVRKIAFPHNEHKCGLTSLLRLTLHFKASDRRDKVYGIAGLLQSSERKRLSPDYYKTEAEVYVDVMKHIINIDKDLSIYSVVTLSTPSILLPSWVPDFSAQNEDIQAGPWIFKRKGRSALASKQNFPSIRKLAGVYTLAVRGIQVDEIQHVFDLGITSESNKEAWDASERVARFPSKAVRENLANLSPPQPQETTFLHSGTIELRQPIWRTLVADKMGGFEQEKHEQEIYKPAPLDYGRMYEVLMGRAETPLSFQPASGNYCEYLMPFMCALIQGRALFITKTGYAGLAELGICKGDTVTMLFGFELPFILRRRDSSSQRMISAAYCSGLMDCEYLNHHSFESQEFLIY